MEGTSVFVTSEVVCIEQVHTSMHVEVYPYMCLYCNCDQWRVYNAYMYCMYVCMYVFLYVEGRALPSALGADCRAST